MTSFCVWTCPARMCPLKKKNLRILCKLQSLWMRGATHLLGQWESGRVTKFFEESYWSSATIQVFILWPHWASKRFCAACKVLSITTGNLITGNTHLVQKLSRLYVALRKSPFAFARYTSSDQEVQIPGNHVCPSSSRPWTCLLKYAEA